MSLSDAGSNITGIPGSDHSAFNRWMGNNWGLIVYFGMAIVYNFIIFSPLGSRFLSLCTGKQHVTSPGAMDRMIMRWPRVMLGTRAPVTAIQSLRCTIQGSIFFATSSLTVAMWSMLTNENDRRRRLLYVIMATIHIAAVIFFSQQMRMVNHLNYMCSKRPKPYRHKNKLSNRHFVDHGEGADRGAFLLSPEQEMTDAEYDAATDEFKHLQLECEMDLDDEAIRMAYILQRAVMNYSLGFRFMLLTLPLILGVIDDIALAVGSFLLIPAMIYYDVILASTRAEPDDHHVMMQRHTQRRLSQAPAPPATMPTS